MNCLVTGGAGFIGSHLVELLLLSGHTVTVVDNYSSGSERNLAHLLQYEDLSVHKIDIRDLELVKEVFCDIDWVFHLAGLADVVPSIDSPNEYFETNVVGTFNLVQSSVESGVKKFVYAASSSCYGIPTQYPTPESAATNPEYPYALTKFLGEQIVMHWAKVYKLPAISLRLFNVFGTRSRTSGTYGAVFGVFLKQKLSNRPFTVVGDGTQTRDFTYVSDVCQAFLRAAQSDISNEVFNVGSGSTYSVNELVSHLGGEVIYIPKRPGEPDSTFADISKIKSKLEWEPSVSLKAGVSKMLEQIDYWNDAPLWDADSISVATNKWFELLS